LRFGINPPNFNLIMGMGVVKEGRHLADLELVESALAGDGDSVGRVVGILESGVIRAALLRRGASASEADELIGDLLGDCFGGEKAKGGIHRLLARYNGGCSLEGFLQRVAFNRLISAKRRARPAIEIDAGHRDEPGSVIEIPDEEVDASPEDATIELLREAVAETLAAADPEKLVLFRLVHSYRVSQKRVGAAWGWHESKVSRALGSLQEELRSGVIERVRSRDPWLELAWEDFLGLCSQSVDLFGE